MEMPGRSVGNDYEFSFNGKLDDKGDSWQTQDYGYRTYDYRLGRFLSTDPKTASYAYLTPYQFASNRPIDGIDLDGKEWSIKRQVISGKDNKSTRILYTLTVKVGFHNLEELPGNFMKLAAFYVEQLYKAEYTTGDGTEVKIETVADFYEIGASEDAPISIGIGEMNIKVPVAMGQTMDKNMGENPTSQDAYITLFRKYNVVNPYNSNDPPITVSTTVWDLIVTIAHELGHTVGLSHDENGQLYPQDASLTDEHNLMYWLKAGDGKAHLETFQVMRAALKIHMDIKNYKSGTKTNQDKPDILGSPELHGNYRQSGDKTT